jgi:GTP-binding protein Era
MPDTPATKFATIVLAGRPNAGKSTLLNALVGTSLAITSPKPQSTRQAVFAVWTEGDTQLLFIDPPGLFEPRYALQELMVEQAVGLLKRADAVLYLHPAHEGDPQPLENLLPEEATINAPVLTVITKADLIATGRTVGESADERPAEVRRPADPSNRLMVSAVTGKGLDMLLEWCRAQAPERPFRYDPDDLSTQPVRFFVTEFVREAAFETLHQELPYALTASVEEFREAERPAYIRVTLYVEKASQKGMVIGKEGATIKRLGALARIKIEALLGYRVYLDLWVSVLPKWRKSRDALRRSGFSDSQRLTSDA